MARLPYVDLATVSPRVRETLERVPAPLRIFYMMAHAGTNLRPLLRLGTSILTEQKLNAALRELAILRVARLSPAEYEWIQHVPIAQAVGVTDAQIQALQRDGITDNCFNATEQLMLRFTTEVVRDVRASDEVFAQMSRSFSPQEIVELILAIGFYMTMARLMETTGVDLEPAPGTRMAEGMKRDK
ncbi:MAG: carboxymuconolactone decarboxylase family protein [Candidatus Binatia bacterium]